MQFNFVWIKGQKHKKTVNVSDSDEDEYKNSGLVYDSEDSDFDVDDVDEVSYFASEKLLKNTLLFERIAALFWKQNSTWFFYLT